MKRVRVPKYRGVYYRESPKQRHAGKPDRCFDISFKDATGRKVWHKVGWASEGYSAALAAQVRAEKVRGMRHRDELPQPKREGMTFGVLWTRYYEWASANKRSHETDRWRYVKHLKGSLAEKRLEEISPFLLEKLKSRMLKKGASPQSVKHVLALVRRMFSLARTWGLYTGENPVARVKLPSTANANRLRFVSPEEAHSLLEEIEKHSIQLRDICLVGLHTGLRAGEIHGLRWGDIDLENSIIHVPDSKSGAARSAYMTEPLRQVFSGRPRGEPRDLVFLSQRGERIKSVSGTFEKAVDRLGLNAGVDDRRQKVVFHTLRHTFGSWLAIRGTPILTIKELMGHRNITMTMRYAHLSPDHKRKAVEGIEELFTNGRGAGEGAGEGTTA